MPLYTLLMASRSISAILWTLVSVNFITLVAGGLITWLGYSIPVRLKQIGLLPELVITAGFGSLIVACIGLGALNYSSHHALNIYGFLCTISALLLLLGLPETWYKSDQFGDGSLLIDIIYFTLLFILILLLVFAFSFAHYLRCQEQIQLETQNHHHHHHHNFQHHLASVQANQQQQRRSLSGYATPNCTCELYVSEGANADGNRNNHNTSILDMWIGGVGAAGPPAAQQEDRHRHRNNNTSSSRFNVPPLGASSQQRTRSSQLSELRAPSLSSNLYNSNSGGNFKEFPYSASVNTTTAAAAAASAQRQAHRRQLQVDATSDDDNLDDHHHHHHHHHHRHQQQQQQLEPLVHKGFYHVPGDSSTIGSNVALRAQSYGRQLNEVVEGDFSSNDTAAAAAALLNAQPTTATSTTIPSATRELLNERCSCLKPSNRSFISSSSVALNEPPTASVDDTLVHYGRLQHQQHCQQGHHLNHFATSAASQTGRHSVAASTLTRCRCHLKSSSPVAHKLGLKGNQESTNIDKNYTKFTNNQSQYNTPMMNSMGTYSARGSHKVRAKGSSSVLAVTAAAAAALFGGVGYASALASDSGCAPDSQFGNMTLGNDDHQQLDYDMRCDIDNNDHQLGVPMLNTDTSDTFQQVNATHKMFS